MTGSVLAAAAALLFAVADDPVFSGPQPGEKLNPFTIIGAIGDDADRKFDVISEAGEKPVVIVFVHERTRPAFAIANSVMRLVSDRGPDKVVGGLVYLSADSTEAAEWMNRVKTYFPENIRKGVSADGAEGPGAYGLNRNVAVTLLVGKAGKVTANFAMIQPSMEVDAPKIFKAIAEVLGEDTVPEVAKYSGMRGGDDPRMKRNTPAAEQQDPMLRPLLVPFIQKTASDDEVVGAANKIEAYAAEHPKSRVQIGDIARRIIAADRLENYGTQKCQEYLTKWAKEFTVAVDSESPKANNRTPDAGT